MHNEIIIYTLSGANGVCGIIEWLRGLYVFIWCRYKNKRGRFYRPLCVVPPGIEPGTQGFSVLCSTNWAMAPCWFAVQRYDKFLVCANVLIKIFQKFFVFVFYTIFARYLTKGSSGIWLNGCWSVTFLCLSDKWAKTSVVFCLYDLENLYTIIYGFSWWLNGWVWRYNSF